MKKSVIIILLLSIVVFFITIDNKSKNMIVNVAVVGDFSNSKTIESIDSFRGMELAVEELNETGKRYNLIRFDIAKYSTLESLKYDIEDNDIQLIIGPSTTGQYMIFKDMLAELNIPVFLLLVSTDEIYEKEDNLFRLTDTLEALVQSMLTSSIDVLEFKDVVIYYTKQNIGFSKPFALGVEQGLSGLDKVRLVEVGDLTDLDVQELLKTPLGNSEAIIIAGPSQAGIIAQLIAKDNQTRILFPSWAKDDRTVEYAESLTNDMYFTSSPEALYTDNFNKFSHDLLENKNIEVNISTYFAYEMFYFVDHVNSEVKSLSLEEVQSYIHNLDYYKGNFNDFFFNSFGDGGRGYDLFVIKNNHFEFVDNLEDE